jgi:hypothetical protein
VDEYVPLTTTEGIENGGMKAVLIDEHELLVAHVGDGYLIHSQFDLRGGRVVRWTDWEGVKLDFGKLLRHPRSLRTYAVKVEGGNILVGPENAPSVAT